MTDGTFDYDSAVLRLEADATKQAEIVLPTLGLSKSKMEYYEHICKDGFGTIDRKKVAKTLYIVDNEITQRKRDTPELKKMNMYHELLCTKFWHADDHWDELTRSMSEEERKFYGTLMIEQARRFDTMGGSSGYSWIVRTYDQGRLREFIDENLLREAINGAFWKLANREFTGVSGSAPADYAVLCKYFDMLDLTNLEMHSGKPLLAGAYAAWITEDYIAAVNRALGKLEPEKGGIITRPVVEAILMRTSDIRVEPEKAKTALATELDPFIKSGVLKAKTVQDLLKEKITQMVCDDEDTYHYTRYIENLRKYVDLPDEGFRDLVSEAVIKSLNKKYNHYEVSLIEADMPPEWINDKAKQEAKKHILEHASEPDRVHGTDKEELVPHLGLLQSAVVAGYLEKETATKVIEVKLIEYVGMPKRPDGGRVETLFNGLREDMVDPGLYKKVLVVGAQDLDKRNRKGAAQRLRDKLEGKRETTRAKEVVQIIF